MKKINMTIAAVAASLSFAFTACSDLDIEKPMADNIDPEPELIENGDMQVTFNCTMEDTDATRTEFHDNTIWWSEGDVITFAQWAKVGGEDTHTSINAKVPSTMSAASINTDKFKTPDSDTDCYFYSFYPSSAFKNRFTTDGNYVKLASPSAQSPKIDGFDPASDLLISKYVKLTSNTDGKYTVNLSYKMVNAIAKMSIVNLPSDDNIKTITFSAKSNGADVDLAGERYYDLITGEPYSYSSNTFSKSITLDYSSVHVTANGKPGMTAYFCCYPFELSAGDSFTVTVTTDAGEVFTKESVIPGTNILPDGFKFEEGKGTKFNVDMKDADMTSPLKLSRYTSGANIPTINSIKCKISSKATNLSSIKYCAVSKEDYYLIANLNDYIDENGNDAGSSIISGLNGGTAYNLPFNNLDIDTEYAILVKGVDTDGKIFISKISERTDWFKLAADTYSNGGILVKITGKGLVSGTKAYKAVLASEVADVTDLSNYYSATVKPLNYGESTLATINGKNGASTNFASTTDWHGNALVSGQKYVVMMSAKNERGETTFRTAEAVAK